MPRLGQQGGGAALREVWVDTESVNAVLNACAQARNAELAFELQAEAEAHGLAPDAVTITTLLLASARDRHETDGARAVETFARALHLGIRPDSMMVGALLRALPDGDASTLPLELLQEVAPLVGSARRGSRAWLESSEDENDSLEIFDVSPDKGLPYEPPTQRTIGLVSLLGQLNATPGVTSLLAALLPKVPPPRIPAAPPPLPRDARSDERSTNQD